MTEPLYRSRLADQPLEFAVEAETRLSDGFRPLDRLSLRHRSFAGGSIAAQREVVRAGACAVVIPFDPEQDAIVLVRQFRIGAALATPNAAPLELPAGLIDPGEAPGAAAARELREETGLGALALRHCWSMLSSPGLSDETVMVFLAIVDASRLAASGGNSEEHEDILTVRADAEALIRAVDDGLVQNAFLITAMHWFARHGRAHARVLADAIAGDDDT